MTVPASTHALDLLAADGNTAERVVPTSTLSTHARHYLPNGYRPEGVASQLIPEETLRLLQSAFSPQLDILLFLACLLRYATLHPQTTMQLSLFQATGETQDEAIILITSVEALAKSPDWHWCPDTTLKIILVLEALHVIRRVFHRSYTELRLFIGEREIFLPELLSSLQRLHDKKKTKKVKQIAKKAMKLLQSDEFVVHHYKVNKLAHELGVITQIIGSVLRQHGIDQKDSQQDILEQASEVIGYVLQPDKYALPSGRIATDLSEFLAEARKQKLLRGEQKGEFLGRSGEFAGTSSTEMEEFTGGKSSVRSVVSATNSPKTQEKRACKRENRPVATEKGEFADTKGMDSPNVGENRLIEAVSGEFVADALSTKESLFSNKDSERDRISIEKADQDSGIRSLEDTQAEATYLWTHLYTKKQREQPHADRFVGGFITRLQEHPDLVRASMVSVLMQFEFPDKRYGPPEGNGSQWFYHTYKRFLAGTLRLDQETQSWIASDYSYAQIERALRVERERQEREIDYRKQANPWLEEKPARPHVSVVQQYGDVDSLQEEGEIAPLEEEHSSLANQDQEMLSDLPQYPPCSAAWTEETLLALFDYYRGYRLNGEWLEYAQQCAQTMVYGGEEAPQEGYTRLQVEMTLCYYLNHLDEWEQQRASWDAATCIPDLWFIGTVLCDVWPTILRRLIESCHVVEMDDGTILSFEEYQDLYERTQQDVRAEEAQEKTLSSEYVEQFHQQFVKMEQEGGWLEGAKTRESDLVVDSSTEELQWTLLVAQERLPRVREALAEDFYDVHISPNGENFASILVYSKLTSAVAKRLMKDGQLTELLESFSMQSQGEDIKE